jgi:phosphatidylserine/phosphatidylglycerophosphate/cardiolipin synthase-like enzyme
VQPDLIARLAACNQFNPTSCVDTEPSAIPVDSFFCLGKYLQDAPKINFEDAATSLENMDLYREQGRPSKGAAPVFGSGTASGSGLNLLLTKNFTYKICGGDRHMYSDAAITNGVKEAMNQANEKLGNDAVQGLVSTLAMNKNAKTQEPGGEAGPSYAARAKFALTNIICIRRLAKEPCDTKFKYPPYVAVTELTNKISPAKVLDKIGAVSISNADITLLPGLDLDQAEALKSSGIYSESYADRLALIKSATKSIKMSTWEIKHDPDRAGSNLKAAIAEARANTPSLDVRIIGDLSTSIGNPYFSQDRMTPGEIPGAVIWMVGANRNYTYHRKLTIIDDETIIFGGKNHAMTYMQLFNGPQDWRDTDIKIKNRKAAMLAGIMFDRDWAANLPSPQNTAKAPLFEACLPQQGTSCFKFIAHDPARQEGYENADSVFTATIQAINSARAGGKIEIENAYVIATNPLIHALSRAAERGANTTIFTNSAESIDVPELVSVMNLSAMAISERVPRVKIFLKRKGKTSTLHSKFMVIDNSTAFLGTYNLHPASRTTAAEFVGVFDQTRGDLDGPVTKLSTLFNSDLSLGRPLDAAYKSEIIRTYEALPQGQKAAVTAILALGYDIL